MTTVKKYEDLIEQIATLRQTVVDQLSSQLIQQPQIADEIHNQIDALYEAALAAEEAQPSPVDFGLSELVGIGPNAAADMDQVQIKPRIIAYDETVTTERIIALADLYYIYKHERIGIFKAVLKMQELFKAGAVRLSSGEGAFGLYQFDRRQVLRYTQSDRMQAYRRAFGYTSAPPPVGATPNRDFHRLFTNFMKEVAQYWRDKRISEVIRPNSDRATFGSVAVVRRAGLDLRNNMKHASYGHLNVLRVELLQLLEEAFDILSSPDILKLFGADNGWDVAEEVMARYYNEPQIQASQHNRMAIAGRNVLNWLGQENILNNSRIEFEGLVAEIADDAEEWLTSAEALGIRIPGPTVPAPYPPGPIAASRARQPARPAYSARPIPPVARPRYEDSPLYDRFETMGEPELEFDLEIG